jgi:hypothetical protein
MKFLAATAALCLLIQGPLIKPAFAETRDCKTLTEPSARLICYDRINPPVATYPIPLPKPSHYIPLTRPDGTPSNAEISESGNDAVAKAKMNGICRGC